jgi:hypothetical protein
MHSSRYRAFSKGWQKMSRSIILVEFETGHHLGAGHFAGVGSTGGTRFQVEVLTLDELVFERHARPPDFIKIDIEGAEAKALLGAYSVLKAFHPLCIIDLHNPEQDVKVGAILSQIGYRAARTEDGALCRDLSIGWPHADGIWGQILAVHPSDPRFAQLIKS